VPKLQQNKRAKILNLLLCAISGKSEAELEQMAKEDFAELQATAALFPDELIESELGEVPRGGRLQT
jgi:type I restriction enzyme S subunit